MVEQELRAIIEDIAFDVSTIKVVLCILLGCVLPSLPILVGLALWLF
jgi:hypothetical protein